MTEPIGESPIRRLKSQRGCLARRPVFTVIAALLTIATVGGGARPSPGDSVKRQDESTEFRRSLTWRILAAGGGMVASLLLTVVIVRGLEPRDAATFFGILAALSIGPLVGRIGLGVNVMRLIPGEPNEHKRRQIAGTHLLGTTIMALASAPIIALIGTYSSIGRGGFLPIFVLSTLLIAIESIRMMVSDIFAANGRVGASVATMHYIRSMLVLPFVGAGVILLGHKSLDQVLGTYLLIAGFQLAIAAFTVRAEIALPSFKETVRTLRIAMGQGVRLFTIDLSEFLIMQGTIWLALGIFDPLRATQYALAVTLGMQITLVKNLALTAVMPPAARLWSTGMRAQSMRMLTNAATLGMWVAIAAFIFVAIFGHWALGIAYGNDMRPAATLLLVIAFGAVVQTCFSVSTALLIISNRIGRAAIVAMIVTLVSIPVAVLAAFWGGAPVLAIVTAASLGTMYSLQYLNARYLLGSAPHGNHHVIRAVREFFGKNPEDDSAAAGGR